MPDPIPINGWNGRARVECAPRQPEPPNVMPIAPEEAAALAINLGRYLSLEDKERVRAAYARMVMDERHGDGPEGPEAA